MTIPAFHPLGRLRGRGESFGKQARTPLIMCKNKGEQTESYGEITGESYIYYYYDDAGSPIGMNWNNADYYFYKNIFGDVLGIMNSSGTMVVRYTYNAWGEPTPSGTGDISTT